MSAHLAEPITGPHRPAPECPGCCEMFVGEPPAGVASITEAVATFESVEHLRGFTALRPRQSEGTHRPRWAEGRQA